MDDMSNDPDTIIDNTIMKLASEYASLERRAKELNEEKKQIRKNASAIGISSLAWQIGVRTVKLMDKDERAEFERGLKRVVGALADRQKELWPEDAERLRKRAEKAAAKAAGEPRSGDELDEKTDADDRSDPNAGGAKPMTGDPDKPWPDDVATGAVPPNPPGEQEAGAAALDAALPETKGKKKSQSQLAREIAEQTGVDKPITVN